MFLAEVTVANVKTKRHGPEEESRLSTELRFTGWRTRALLQGVCPNTNTSNPKPSHDWFCWALAPLRYIAKFFLQPFSNSKNNNPVAKGNVFREAVIGETGKLDLGELMLPQEKQNEISFAWMPQIEDGGVCLKEKKKTQTKQKWTNQKNLMHSVVQSWIVMPRLFLFVCFNLKHFSCLKYSVFQKCPE